MNAATDNARIAQLTSDAVRHEGERVIAELMRNVEMMEQEAADMRSQADRLAADIRKHTGLFADHTTGFVERCQKMVEMMQSVETVFVESTRPLESSAPVNERELIEAMRMPASTEINVPEGEKLEINRPRERDLFSTMKGDH